MVGDQSRAREESPPVLPRNDPGTELRHIWSGRVSGLLKETCIGNCAILPDLMSRFRAGPDVSAKKFWLAFIDTFAESPLPSIPPMGLPTIFCAKYLEEHQSCA